TVRVQVDCAEGQARIVVSDNGIGIDATMLARLFETFSQADRSLDRSRGGLGLGLALVKGLVDLHGGDVRAHSAGLGKGTEIAILLPALDAPAALERQKGTVAPTGAATCRVLVIEDNRDAAESLRTLLFLTGHVVEIAHSGSDGL